MHPLAETSLDLEMRGVVHPLTLPHTLTLPQPLATPPPLAMLHPLMSLELGLHPSAPPLPSYAPPLHPFCTPPHPLQGDVTLISARQLTGRSTGSYNSAAAPGAVAPSDLPLAAVRVVGGRRLRLLLPPRSIVLVELLAASPPPPPPASV